MNDRPTAAPALADSNALIMLGGRLTAEWTPGDSSSSPARPVVETSAFGRRLAAVS